MSIASIPSFVLETSSSSSNYNHSLTRFHLNSCNPRSFNLPNSSSSSSCGFSALRRFPLRRRHRSGRIRAVSENLGSVPDPLASTSNNCYHPSEDIEQLVSVNEDARLTDAETARTLVQVNSKATLIFSGLSDDEIHENIIWPDLPYLTDERGGELKDIYFEVSNHENVLQNLIGDDKIVQVIIGFDDLELLKEMDISGPSDFDFAMEEITGEDSDIDGDSDEDGFTLLEDEEDDLISSKTANDWSNLETMQYSHPMYFARKIEEVVSNVNMDWMDQPSASIVVQGVLRPAFQEENSFIRKHLSVGGTSNDQTDHLGNVVEENIKEELDNDQTLDSVTAFYKLEMVRIQLVSSYGTESLVEVQDFRKARPDVVVHHSANIVSQLESAGDKTFQALKSLCWRLKSIQVEEAAIIGVDSLGFDLRVCSRTQVQTLRFAFKSRATSELNAEKQLQDLLFPRFQNENQK